MLAKADRLLAVCQHKTGRSREGGYQTEQAVPDRKLLDRFLDFIVRLLAHAHPSDIDSIQHNPLILRQRVINAGLRRLCRSQIQSTILRYVL